VNAHGNVVRLVDREGQLVGEGCPGCVEHSKTIGKLSRKISELENGKAEKIHPLDKQIMDVCVFHKQLLSPTWKIVRNKGAYNDVKTCLAYVDAETGRPAYTPRHLKAASVGMSMDEWCREQDVKSASWLFSDVDAGQRDPVQARLRGVGVGDRRRARPRRVRTVGRSVFSLRAVADPA
jgi:hypothetical protein